MDKSHLLENLEKFKNRLKNEVAPAYSQRGSDFGQERFNAWRRELNRFLDEHLPGSRARLDKKLTHIAYTIGRNESDYSFFMRYDGNPSLAFIESLAIDIKNDEYSFDEKEHDQNPQLIEKKAASGIDNTRVFIVHGHDENLKVKTARFIERLGYKPIILHEQASQGQTIIEKIETQTDVGFAIVLYTEDDLGNDKKQAENGSLNLRARQNVIFEHGYLIAKLSRARVVPLVAGAVELPSDISGVVYVNDKNWQIDIAKEMKACGYDIDFNKLIDF